MTPGSPSADDGARRETAELPALGWLQRAQAEDELLLAVEQRVRRRRRRVVAAAGILSVAALLAFFLVPLGQQTGEVENRSTLTARISRPERRILPDNTVVELKEGARLTVDYSGAFRRVTLLQGEAHFEVVKNPRPFVVDAAGIQVYAVGTAFSVELGSERVGVLVTEGQVQVGPDAAPYSLQSPGVPASAVSRPSPGATAPPSALLAVGHRASIERSNAAPTIGIVTAAEMRAHLSWRIPSLEFSRTPLSEVVALMNQHAEPGEKIRFVIADPELADVRLSGFLRTDNREGLIRLLEHNFGIQAERSDDTFVLRKKR